MRAARRFWASGRAPLIHSQQPKSTIRFSIWARPSLLPRSKRGWARTWNKLRLAQEIDERVNVGPPGLNFPVVVCM